MNLQKINVLDCTLRDGGYYTNWDFPTDLIQEYCEAMEESCVDYVEVGYRSIPMKQYLGKYFYCPISELQLLKKLMPSKKLVIILNEKDIRETDVDLLLKPCIGLISMVRIAVDPKNFERAILLAIAIKKLNFEVAFNVMYMSDWTSESAFISHLDKLKGVVDLFYMVDSYGGVMPDQVRRIIQLIKSKTDVALGFHGHNNLEMALANTIEALKEGCEIVDATLTGMGRGAGNLRTELLLTYLDGTGSINQKFNKLSVAVSSFEKLKAIHKWGSSLPYMFSGAHSLPQKEVMVSVVMNRYPISSMLNALSNQKRDVEDNVKLSNMDSQQSFDKAIILGGGKSVYEHREAIKKLICKEESICLIHAGARNVKTYLDIDKKQYYSLTGSESDKLLKQIGDFSKISQTCIYPPFPRKMGTSIPDDIKKLSRELEAITFTKASDDSPFSVSVQVALNLKVNQIFLAGFDGYDTTLDQTQFALANENQLIINDLSAIESVSLHSLTDTKYKNIEVLSVYSLI